MGLANGYIYIYTRHDEDEMGLTFLGGGCLEMDRRDKVI